MTNTIEHQGIVENITGSHIQVRIVQTSACATCSVKGHCSSADSKEKLIDIFDAAAGSYHVGDRVMLVGATSMGMWAVVLAFVIPFLVLVVSLFLFMAWLGNDWQAAAFSFVILIPYYYVLWRNKERMSKKFSFTIKK